MAWTECLKGDPVETITQKPCLWWIIDVNKKPQFQKIRKLQNLIHFNEQGISCVEIRVVSDFDASSKCCKMMEQSWPLAIKFMGRWTGCIHVLQYRKTSLAPLNILGSVDNQAFNVYYTTLLILLTIYSTNVAEYELTAHPRLFITRS